MLIGDRRNKNPTQLLPLFSLSHFLNNGELFCFLFVSHIHALFISNTFINNARLKLAKNQANAKQRPEAEYLLFENYSHFSHVSIQKWYGNSWNISERKVCLYSWNYTINHKENKNKNKNRSHRYDINRSRCRHGRKYSKCKKCLCMIMLICV